MIEGQSSDRVMRPLQDEGSDEEDLELRRLRMKKLLELQKKLLASQAKVAEEVQEDPEEFVKRHLTERALRVLEAAKAQYPEITRRIIEAIADAIRRGEVETPIEGEVLYNTFLRLGLPIRLETRIRIYQKGRYIDIREKLRED